MDRNGVHQTDKVGADHITRVVQAQRPGKADISHISDFEGVGTG